MNDKITTATKSKLRKEVWMVLDRETKGTYLFHEVDEKGNVMGFKDPGTVFGTLYVRKTALDGLKPPAIRITLDVA